VCVCLRQKLREQEGEIASEEIGGSIISRQEVCQSQREREQDTQRRVESEQSENKEGGRGRGKCG